MVDNSAVEEWRTAMQSAAAQLVTMKSEFYEIRAIHSPHPDVGKIFGYLHGFYTDKAFQEGQENWPEVTEWMSQEVDKLSFSHIDFDSLSRTRWEWV